jgi:protein tyrosine phosphatase
MTVFGSAYHKFAIFISCGSSRNFYGRLDQSISVDMCIKYDKPVYVHCWSGKGRTGTVVGCYLARHGMAADIDVIEMIREIRKNTEDFSDPSPETKEQINMVINWTEGL